MCRIILKVERFEPTERVDVEAAPARCPVWFDPDQVPPGVTNDRIAARAATTPAEIIASLVTERVELKYREAVMKLFAIVCPDHRPPSDAEIKRMQAYILANDPNWVALKQASEDSDTPVSTIQGWIDSGDVRYRKPGWNVMVYMPDVRNCLILKGRKRRDPRGIDC
jgi:hypothetical protein